jgi:hypothetical protein
MTTSGVNNINSGFNRDFFESGEVIAWIGEGSFGGKASGLALADKVIKEKINHNEFPDIILSIPRMIVLRTDVFDAFMKRNNLFEIAYSDERDEDIILAFLHADLPSEILGDLRSIVDNIFVPLAVRSSSMLEDAKNEPFAGIYATKMIPNNQTSHDERFIKLIEAIKFIYASTFLKASKDYFKVSTHSFKEEKMAVIIQEIVGQKYTDRFYPDFAGVARSFNFFPAGKAKPEQGAVCLALGLGKTIVDGGLVWNYSPAYPKSVPPFNDTDSMLKNTQTKFWAVNMSHSIEYDPTKEEEYMIQLNLSDADYDDTLNYIASTYDASSDRMKMGSAGNGPRVINFARLLTMNEFRYNELINLLMKVYEDELNWPVEIEFAVSIPRGGQKLHFGFLQVRPAANLNETVEVDLPELQGESVLVASNKVMGNGILENICDVVFVKPETFDKKHTPKIACEIDAINKNLVREKMPYLLIGFGRWGSTDPWLGIPVEWGQIGGARVIVESTLFDINVELSQGSHFFHNLTSFNVSYFSITFDGEFEIDWNWLNSQSTITDNEFVKHVKLAQPLKIKVDGRKSRGVVKKW